MESSTLTVWIQIENWSKRKITISSGADFDDLCQAIIEVEKKQLSHCTPSNLQVKCGDDVVDKSDFVSDKLREGWGNGKIPFLISLLEAMQNDSLDSTLSKSLESLSLSDKELSWYNLCPTLSNNQLKMLAKYDPKAINPFHGAAEIAKSKDVEIQKIYHLMTPQSIVSPSTFAIPNNFLARYNDGSISYVPFTKSVPSAPLSLVSKPIIAFQTALTNFKHLSEDEMLSYQDHAVQFLHKMRTITNESDMYEPLQAMFHDILSHLCDVEVDHWKTANSSGKGHDIECDGSVKVNNIPCIIVEANGYTSSTNPVLQAIGFFQHMVKTYGSGNLTCALLVVVMGDLMSIYGCHAFVNGDGNKQYLVELLCPPLSLRFGEGIEWCLNSIASVLYGCVCFVQYISKDAPKLEFCHLTLAKILDEFNPVLTPEGPLRPMCPLEGKLVFEFDSYREMNLAVKFVKGYYGEDVHRYLSSKGYAPKLYQVCQLPLNWKAVVMERVQDDPSMPCDYNAQLMCILKCLQEKNYVHGDLRKPNILNGNGRLQICDFDWAGEEGMARYPFHINDRDIEWPRQNLSRRKIIKDDDNWWIQQLTST